MARRALGSDRRTARTWGGFLADPPPQENLHGLRAAIVLTQTHERLLSPAIAAATDPAAEFPRLRRALDNVRGALDDYAKRQGLAA